MTGTIRNVVSDRGFFFIRPDGDHGQGDHFGHVKHLHPSLLFHELEVGQRVDFDSQQGPKGLVAVNIQPA